MVTPTTAGKIQPESPTSAWASAKGLSSECYSLDVKSFSLMTELLSKYNHIESSDLICRRIISSIAASYKVTCCQLITQFTWYLICSIFTYFYSVAVLLLCRSTEMQNHSLWYSLNQYIHSKSWCPIQGIMPAIEKEAIKRGGIHSTLPTSMFPRLLICFLWLSMTCLYYWNSLAACCWMWDQLLTTVSFKVCLFQPAWGLFAVALARTVRNTHKYTHSV